MLHVPLRRCRVCRRQAPKRSLKRWTVQEGRWQWDERQVAPGRGYYTCSEKCEAQLGAKKWQKKP